MEYLLDCSITKYKIEPKERELMVNEEEQSCKKIDGIYIYVHMLGKRCTLIL